MFIGILAILAAITLSIVSAYFSVTGIVTIFSGAAVGAALMGGTLELAKLTGTVWLYSWWKKANAFLKGYLILAVSVLIIISSIGIYGYLAKAYVGQRNPGVELENRIERIDRSIAREERVIESAQSALDQLDSALDRLIELDYLGYGLDRREEQKEERDQLKQEIIEAEEEISILLDQRFELENQLNDFSVDVGPIQYIAALLYGEDDAEQYFDNAVRAFILLLVLVFDPFAVLLMVAGNISIDQYYRKRKRSKNRKKNESKKNSSEEVNLLKKTLNTIIEQQKDTKEDKKSTLVIDQREEEPYEEVSNRHYDPDLDQRLEEEREQEPPKLHKVEKVHNKKRK